MPETATLPWSEILTTEKYMPCISILLPFEPKMGLRKELDHKLKLIYNQIERELQSNYPEEKINPVLDKLSHVIQHLNYLTHKKSIAIFVSPLIEKVYYLNTRITEQVVIDQSFEIRNLVYSKKETARYLLAVLSHKSSKIFLADENTIVRITSNIPEHVEAYQHDLPEKVANFSDESKQKEILLDRFLRRTDNAIGLLLNAYKTPLFVMGTDRTLGHFKALSKNTRHIVDYIHGNFDEKTPFELQQLMKPHVQDWKKIKEVKMLKMIEEAAGKKKLAEGIDEVWKSAALKKGRIMIVENDFVYQARQGGLPEVIYGKDELSQSAFYIKDAVDDAIEKVLSAGGDVEFVGHDVLKERGRVVLIEYY